MPNFPRVPRSFLTKLTNSNAFNRIFSNAAARLEPAVADETVRIVVAATDAQDIPSDVDESQLEPLIFAPPLVDMLPPKQGDMSPRIADFLKNNAADLVDACLVVDVDVVEHNYHSLRRVLPLASVYYAVKANPSDEVVSRLASLGSSFDAASVPEIELCMRLGVNPERISYGNTIKKRADIRHAFNRGVRMFAFDSDEELQKIAEEAPGSKVYCRILVPSEGAEWPLSRKFGCEPSMAKRLLAKSAELGLDPYGVSFHVGSQQTDPTQWRHAVGLVAGLFADLRKDHGVNLRMINLGGGLPARYMQGVLPPEDYADVIMGAIKEHFGDDETMLPKLITEPGRSIAGDAGVIQAEVVLISRKSDDDPTRWVYLDIGKFSGLAETMDEAIKYRIITPRCRPVPTTDELAETAGTAAAAAVATGPVILAGPTCDSADIMYEKTKYELPLDLAIGDKIHILSTGAYTTTYSAVAFNGFSPLRTVCI